MLGLWSVILLGFMLSFILVKAFGWGAFLAYIVVALIVSWLTD